ncbi:MAG: hypothetical protein RIE52_12940 [Balneola sp.]|jgi:hypothetical protein
MEVILFRMKNLFLLLAFSFLMVTCDTLTAEEIARLSFTETSNTELNVEEVSLELKKGEKIHYWTEIDVEYENDLSLVYDIEVWKDSVKLGGLQGNAFETNPTMMEIKKSFGSKTSWSFAGRMFTNTIKEDGNYTFFAVIRSSDNPTLKLNKAELVLKK